MRFLAALALSMLFFACSSSTLLEECEELCDRAARCSEPEPDPATLQPCLDQCAVSVGALDDAVTSGAITQACYDEQTDLLDCYNHANCLDLAEVTQGNIPLRCQRDYRELEAVCPLTSTTAAALVL